MVDLATYVIPFIGATYYEPEASAANKGSAYSINHILAKLLAIVLQWLANNLLVILITLY